MNISTAKIWSQLTEHIMNQKPFSYGNEMLRIHKYIVF